MVDLGGSLASVFLFWQSSFSFALALPGSCAFSKGHVIKFLKIFQFFPLSSLFPSSLIHGESYPLQTKAYQLHLLNNNQDHSWLPTSVKDLIGSQIRSWVGKRSDW